MPNIRYVNPATIDDVEVLAILERARRYGTPRPESHAIRAHNPEVLKAFYRAWETFFRRGRCEHSVKELCRLYIAKTIGCAYSAGERSLHAGIAETKVDELLNFESSGRFDARETAALAWARAIASDTSAADDDLWATLHEQFSEPELVELGHFIALTLGEQRLMKTLGLQHGQVLANTTSGLTPGEAAKLRSSWAPGTMVRVAARSNRLATNRPTRSGRHVLRRLRAWLKTCLDTTYPLPMDGGLPYLPAQMREIKDRRNHAGPSASETDSPDPAQAERD